MTEASQKSLKISFQSYLEGNFPPSPKPDGWVQAVHASESRMSLGDPEKQPPSRVQIWLLFHTQRKQKKSN